jgi:hypothetical protein
MLFRKSVFAVFLQRLVMCMRVQQPHVVAITVRVPLVLSVSAIIAIHGQIVL